MVARPFAEVWAREANAAAPSRIQAQVNTSAFMVPPWLRRRLNPLLCGLRRAFSGFAPVVFFADLLEQLPCRVQLHLKLLGPRRGEDFRIVDGDVVGDRGCIGKPQLFDGVEGVAMPTVAGR